MNMDKLFKPESIAIVGVSDKATNMARNIVWNLQEFSYDGIIYAVGPRGGHLFGRRIYKSVSDIPDSVDCAVILTPADTIPDILDECGKKGIKHAVIESAGFREFGEPGQDREKRVIEITKKHDIKFIGPNCIGLMNLNKGLVLPFLKLNDIYTRGGVSIVTQSGGVGVTLLNVFSSESIGISKFASIGNKLSIDENDVIEYLLDDPETEIIVVYLEGISDGKRLMQIARHSAKPILVFKANVGQLGRTIAASHTAALSSDDKVVSAALKQVGIARFKARHTMTDYLKILPMPRMKGKNLAILSRSGGHAIMAADEAEQEGFDLAPFKESFIKEIEKHFRANVIKLTNPLDLGDLFDYDLYMKIIEMTVKESSVDGVVFLHTYFSNAEGEASRNLIEKTHELSNKYGKPICVCVTTDDNELSKLKKILNQPVFTSPLEVVKSLSLARDFHYGIKKEPELTEIKAEKGAVLGIIEKCKKEGRSPLLQEGLDIFIKYKIPTIPSSWVTSEKEATLSAGKLGFPVVLKVVSHEISHKTDIGGVELNLRNEAQVKEAFAEITATIKQKMPGARLEGMVVQPMLKRGWEMMIGAKRDQNFGPVILVGLGGIFVEVFKDTAMRVVPFSREEATEMLGELKGYPILKGVRGKGPYDIEAILDSVMNLQILMNDFPEISEIDINPFYVLPSGSGGMALDARVVLG